MTRSTPIADDPSSWEWPDDVVKPGEDSACPKCGVPWAYHFGSVCPKENVREDGA